MNQYKIKEKIINKLNNIKFKSIKDKVFYFSFFVSISIIFLIIFTSYFFTYRTLKNTSISREKTTLELISNQTEITLNFAESNSTNLMVDNDVQTILKKCSLNNIYPTKEEILKLQREIDKIMYKDSVISGAILHSTNGFKMQSNSKFISLIHSNHITIDFNKWYGGILDIQGKPNLYISRQIFDMNTGKLIGYLELFIKETFLSENYTNNKGKSNYINFFLINDDGFITSSSNSEDITNNIYKKIPNIKFANKDNPFLIIEDKSKDKLTLMLYNNKLNWNIVADIYLEDIIHEKESLIISLIILIFIGLLCSYILSKLISKSIIKPIHNLYYAIAEVEKGNWSTEIKITSSDEIGILSKKFNHLIVYIKNLLDKIKYEQNKKKEFEFELIQLQIKPHFLYNSLENISALIELEKNDEAVNMLENLSTFYRSILNKGNTFITIKEEISLTENYLKIMKYRYYDIFDYKINYDKSIENFTCLKLLLQPLVENSIYHGIKNSKTKGLINIDIEKFKNNIKIIIKDTGIGMTESELKRVIEGKIASSSKGGFAVKNTIERLNLFYDKNCTFNIISKKNIGTTIIITIPAIYKK